MKTIEKLTHKELILSLTGLLAAGVTIIFLMLGVWEFCVNVFGSEGLI